MSEPFVTYAGLRKDPRFAELLADYDRVSLQRDDLLGELTAEQARNDALRAVVAELAQWIDVNGDHALRENGAIFGASPCYCGLSELIARARAMLG